ncbi:hypothetical protein RBB78_13600 [Tunturiibacter empetritectus]|uniref:hypothetical protein n=1 Tax=Tunturiibacter empetritectus TaxID=3069691 RepID=UPI003D9B4A76
MAMRAMSWPATSSMTTWPGSSRPDSWATMVAAGMPMSVARIAAMVVPIASRDWSRMEEVGRSVPEQDGGDAAVGAGAGLQQACSEEGADGPRPEGLLFGRRMGLDVGVRH